MQKLKKGISSGGGGNHADFVAAAANIMEGHDEAQKDYEARFPGDVGNHNVNNINNNNNIIPQMQQQASLGSHHGF